MKKRRTGTWKDFLFFFFFLWTGILFCASIRRYYLAGSVEQKMVSILMKRHFSDTGVLQAVHSGSNLFFPELIKDSSLLLSFVSESEQEDRKEKKEKPYPLLASKEVIKEQKKKETAVPVSEIVLFDNGGFDITSKNSQMAEKERSIGETPEDDRPGERKENERKIKALYKNFSRDYLLKNFYITDSSTSIDNKIFQVRKLLNMDLRLKQEKKPQILIIHTHGASEAFKDSKKGKEDSIIGVGTRLAAILSKQYGYQVIHDKTEYDRIGGQIDRNRAYNMSLEGTKKLLKKYPSIELVIDLHRDGVGNKVNRTTLLDGKRTAQVMFFNGLSRSSSGDIAYLKNPNLQGNLAFSLQLKLACMRHFKEFAKPIYLKGYRYNMHLKKRYTLIELGNENNTVAEAKNAAAPLALVIHEVLHSTSQ